MIKKSDQNSFRKKNKHLNDIEHLIREIVIGD